MKLFFKNFICIILFGIITIFLSSCSISTPEQLLQAPQLNTSKKEMIDAVERFKPQNTVDYFLIYYQDNKPTNMIIKDLDNDGQNEIISFYRSKVTEKIGVVILGKIDGIWQKKFENFFETYEIFQVWIDDLDGNKNREILLQCYSYNVEYEESDPNTKKFTIVYQDSNNEFNYTEEIPFSVMSIGKLTSNSRENDVVICEKNNSIENDNIINFVIYNFDGEKLIKKIGKALNGVSDPYNITIGKVTDDKIGIFLNFLNDKFYAMTRIFFYDAKQNQILSSKNAMGFNETDHILNLESIDIDKDGIVEVGYYFKSPNYTVPIEDMSISGLINGYFKILPGNKLEFVREIYYDAGLEYLINFPKSFKGKYTLKVSEDGLDVYVNYVDSEGTEYPLFNVKKVKKWEFETNVYEYQDMQVITTGEDYLILGSIEDYSANIYGDAKEEYLSLRQDIIVLENIIEVQKY